MKQSMILLWLIAAVVAPAAEDGFSAYKVLSERNIFSPTRGTPVEEREEQTPEAPVVLLDAIKLLGVVVVDGLPTAFFAGNVEGVSGMRQLGDRLAGLEVKTIATTGVLLAGEQGELKLAVGSAMTRRGDEEWQIAAEAPPIPGYNPSSSPVSTSSSSPPEASSSGGSASDILKRLRERRQQELKQ